MKLTIFTLAIIFLLVSIECSRKSLNVCDSSGGPSCPRAQTLESPQPTPPPPTLPMVPQLQCTLSAIPPQVVYGNPVSLTLTVPPGVTVSSAKINGNAATVGEAVQLTPTTSQTFLASVTSAGQTAPCQASVIVTPPPAPSCNLAANPSSINPGGSSALSWSISGVVTNAAIDGQAITTAQGTEPVQLQQSHNYALHVVGPGGDCSSSASVTVLPNPPPSTAVLTATPSPVTIPTNAAGQFLALATFSLSITTSAPGVLQGVSSQPPGIVCDANFNCSLPMSGTFTLTGTVSVGGIALSPQTQVVVTPNLVDPCNGLAGDYHGTGKIYSGVCYSVYGQTASSIDVYIQGNTCMVSQPTQGFLPTQLAVSGQTASAHPPGNPTAPYNCCTEMSLTVSPNTFNLSGVYAAAPSVSFDCHP